VLKDGGEIESGRVDDSWSDVAEKGGKGFDVMLLECIGRSSVA
jgi:hypothetical protein